jgi:hypothetical protein
MCINHVIGQVLGLWIGAKILRIITQLSVMQGAIFFSEVLNLRLLVFTGIYFQ